MEAEQVHIGEIMLDGVIKSKMDRRSVFMVSIEHLTMVVKRSIESALTPAPLFLAVCRIVLQMSPGREYG